MLPKSAESVLLALNDFVVATDPRGRVVGCAAVREYSPSLAEVASVAVAPEAHGLGVGGALVRRVEQLAHARGIAELFALTTTPAVLSVAGLLRRRSRTLSPEKIRRDCVGCPRRARMRRGLRLPLARGGAAAGGVAGSDAEARFPSCLVPEPRRSLRSTRHDSAETAFSTYGPRCRPARRRCVVPTCGCANVRPPRLARC